MHIFLYGPPGAGKTMIGRLLAAQLDLPLVDMDSEIEAGQRMSIPQIMGERGQEGFRDLESALLREVASGPESVVALGGGALLRAENRELAERNGRVACLNAGHETLFERLNGDGDGRPLLAGDLRGKLNSLLETRREHYHSFPLQVEAERSPESILWRIQIATGRFRLKAMKPCDVTVQDGGLDSLGEMLAVRGMKNPIIVTDENVAKRHSARALASLRRAGYKPEVLVIPAGEEAKNLETVNSIWKAFLENGLDRSATVVALGGGVVSDLAGFAASAFMRGVAWVVVPTTLLSMVDASLGGKTGFDLPEGKNLVGSFHSPRLVLSDPELLSTLPEEEFRSGMAEVIKHGIIADPGLFERCARGLNHIKERPGEVIRRAIAVKVKIIEEDPWETGLRGALNLGHTVGHAIEHASGLRLRHGEAVAVGLVVEAKLAEHLGIAATGLSDTIAAALVSQDLPVRIPGNLQREDILRLMRVDKKKRDGLVRFALPVEIGRVQTGVEVKDLEMVFRED